MGIYYKTLMQGGSLVVPTWNTKIGGVSAAITSASILATKLGISVGRISNFEIIGSDVKCNITGTYALSWANDTTLKYYIDSDNLVTNYGFVNDTKFSKNGIDFKGVINLTTTYSIRNTYLQKIILENCVSVVDGGFYIDGITIPREYYIPRVTSLGSSALANNMFNGSQVDGILYCHPSLATNNSGAPDGDVAFFISNGGTVRYVANFTAPSAITNLTVGTIFNTAIQLTFTAPSSTNTIDYYEVYANGVYISRFVSGDFVYGLTPSTLNLLTVYVVDIYRNKSLVSNIVSATTLSTQNGSVPTSGLVSYYKLNETSGTTAVDSYGADNLTNTNIWINENGLIGKSVESNFVEQKLQTLTATPITGNFSINIWTMRTAKSQSLGTLVERGTYMLDKGFGFWVDASNNAGWRINRLYGTYSSMNLPLNKWSMVTMTYDGSNIRLYLNSVLKQTIANTTNPTTTGQKTMFYGHVGAQYFGRLCESAEYNRAISQSEINTFYNSGAGITY